MNTPRNLPPRPGLRRPGQSAFTMVEIALSLAVIGFALVAILGVLPIGVNTQRDNREDTIVNHDATLWMDALRAGNQGVRFGVSEDLSNYVISVTKTVVVFDTSTTPWTPDPVINTRRYSNLLWPQTVGLLSTPRYQSVGGNTVLSNSVVADVRAMTGSGATRWPQNNDLIKEAAFTYRITATVEDPSLKYLIDPLASSVAPPDGDSTRQQLNQRLRGVRLDIRWPVLPNGKTGLGRRTYSASFGGMLLSVPAVVAGEPDLWFFQPTIFANQP